MAQGYGVLEADGGRTPLLARACGQREASATEPGTFCIADRRNRPDPDAAAEVVSPSPGRGIRRVTKDRINTGDLLVLSTAISAIHKTS